MIQNEAIYTAIAILVLLGGEQIAKNTKTKTKTRTIVVQAKPKRRGNTKGKKAKKIVDRLFLGGYALAEIVPGKEAYEQASGDQTDKAWAALKAKAGFVGKEYGLAKDEFRLSTFIYQHKLTGGLVVVDWVSDKTGAQKWVARRIKRFL